MATTGDTVTISGTNFTDATEVIFGGVPADRFKVNKTGTAIDADVGAGATGSIRVVTPGGTATIVGFTFQ